VASTAVETALLPCRDDTRPPNHRVQGLPPCRLAECAEGQTGERVGELLSYSRREGGVPVKYTACPECHQPAEIQWDAVLDSTDGPVAHVKILCVQRHWFFLPGATIAVAASELPSVDTSLRLHPAGPTL
jgi:hypothetical protein